MSLKLPWRFEAESKGTPMTDREEFGGAMAEAASFQGDPAGRSPIERWLIRELLSSHLAHLWSRRHEDRTGWPDDDRRLLAAMEEHREFHPLWNRLDRHVNKDIVVHGLDPILHVVVHAMVTGQIEAEDPPEVPETWETLKRYGFSPHRALHVIGHVILAELHDMKKSNRPFDERRYRSRLQLIQEGCKDPRAWSQLRRQTGRNEPCPCGSGVKFKKCCRELLEMSLHPFDWAFLLGGQLLYCSYGYAAKADDGDPAVLLENMAAVAWTLDVSLDDPEGAFHCLQDMLQLAEEANRLVENVLTDIVVFCLNHPEYAAEGLKAVDRLRGESAADDPAELVEELDRADFLTYLGRVDEARVTYERALEAARRDDIDPELREIIGNRWAMWKEDVLPRAGIAAKGGSAGAGDARAAGDGAPLL